MALYIQIFNYKPLENYLTNEFFICDFGPLCCKEIFHGNIERDLCMLRFSTAI